jgi:succinate dehydrogenase / fumarate reductase membrane anchor subunit
MHDQRWWTWHVAAGLVILVFLGLHMVIMHLDAVVGIFNPHGGHPIEWANVVERAKSAFFMVTYIVLLGAALFHGLYGLRNILFELNPASALKRGLNIILVAGGFGLFALGTWAAWQSFVLASTHVIAHTL